MVFGLLVGKYDYLVSTGYGDLQKIVSQICSKLSMATRMLLVPCNRFGVGIFQADALKSLLHSLKKCIPI